MSSTFPQFVYQQQQWNQQHAFLQAQTNSYEHRQYHDAMYRFNSLPLDQRRAMDQAIRDIFKCTPSQQAKICVLFGVGLFSFTAGIIASTASDTLDSGLEIGFFSIGGLSILLSVGMLFKNRVCPPPSSDGAEVTVLPADESTPLTSKTTAPLICCRGTNTCTCKKVSITALLLFAAMLTGSWGSRGLFAPKDNGLSIFLDATAILLSLAALTVIFKACIYDRR